MKLSARVNPQSSSVDLDIRMYQKLTSTSGEEVVTAKVIIEKRLTWRGNLGVKSSSSTIYFILGNYHSPIFFLWVNVEFCFQQVDCSGSKCLFIFAEKTLHLGLNLSLRTSSDFLCGCSFSYFTVTHFI